MNIQEYIESGMLELYASGALSPAEAAEVEQLLKKHPELKEELEEIEISLEQYAGAFAREPRKELKQSILSSLDDEIKVKPLYTGQQEVKIKPISSGRVNYLAAASIALALVSMAAAFYYYGKWRSTETQLADLRSQNQLFAEQNNTYKASLEKKTADMAIMRNSGNMVVKMKNDNSSMLATVYYDKNAKKAFLDVNSLPALPSDKQYQLWAIVDAKPVDMGVFDVMPAGEIKLLPMKEIENPQAFAVTIEPKGGSPAPTSTPMMVGAVI